MEIMMVRWPRLRNTNNYTDTDMEILKALFAILALLVLLAGVLFVTAVIAAILKLANEDDNTNENDI